MTRGGFSATELETLERAYKLTSRIPILAAQVVAEQLAKPGLTPGEAAVLVGKATRLCSMVRRELVRFLPPDAEPQRGDLEALILADACAPGVDLAERVKALEALREVGAQSEDVPASTGDPWAQPK